MKKEEFFELIRERMEERMEDGTEVRLHEVVKNNHVVKHGIMICDKERNIAPTLYLDEFYEEHEAGRDLEEILQVISDNLKRGMPHARIDMDFFMTYEKVKDKICYRLINYEKNEELLREIPHLPFLDLAICFYYPFWHEEIGKGSILIRNEHVEKWNVTVKELWKVANENTRELYPEVCCPMDKLLLEMTRHEEEAWTALPEEGWGCVSMKVLTNKQRIFGAAVILYDDYLKQLSDCLQGDFFMIPSSIHEVLILPAVEGECETLEKMICEVNATTVDPQEVLSDHLYRYERDKARVCIAV